MDAITAYFDDPANYDKLVNGLTDELLHEHVDCGRVYEATGKTKPNLTKVPYLCSPQTNSTTMKTW